MASQSQWVGRVALVTGGSAGIGEATTRLLLSKGMRVVICARNLGRLQELDKELNNNKTTRCLLAVQCDISKEEQVLEMFEQIRSEFGRLDICINNAGLSKKDVSLLEGSTASWQVIFDVNVIGLSICTREAIKLMREKGIDDGHILHVSSMSGHRQVPGAGFMYTASKNAVRILTEGLRQELRQLKSNIRVSCVSPAIVKTDFAKELREDFDDFLANSPGLTSEEVAGVIWNCISQPPNVQIHDVLLRATHQTT